MKKIFILTFVSVISLFSFSGSAKAAVITDPLVLAAVLEQTATQTAEHLTQLAQAIQTVQTLQQQLSNTQNILQLAQANAQGVDGLQVAGNFQNVVLSTNSLINSIQSEINTTQNLSSQWQNLFGTLTPWIQNANTTFANINASDNMNTASYLVGDSYQQLYQKNADIVAQFTANANQVSEKGALKQIAVETAQLIQMENNVIYLLSQLLKEQSIESSNQNTQRKQQAVQLQQENQGVQSFMNVVDNQTFNI